MGLKPLASEMGGVSVCIKGRPCLWAGPTQSKQQKHCRPLSTCLLSAGGKKYVVQPYCELLLFVVLLVDQAALEKTEIQTFRAQVGGKNSKNDS